MSPGFENKHVKLCECSVAENGFVQQVQMGSKNSNFPSLTVLR